MLKKYLPLALCAVGAIPACAATPDIPIACRLDALTPTERARHAEERRALVAAVRSVAELDDGFSLTFDAAALETAGAWISRERRCCPFLRFELTVGAGEVHPTLALRGRPGVKEFLRAELGTVAAR